MLGGLDGGKVERLRINLLLYGLIVQWLGHAAVNRSIGVRVPVFPLNEMGTIYEMQIVYGEVK